jgi:hypothetical protein
MAHFAEFSTAYRTKAGVTSANPELATEIATVREAANTPNSAALALLAAMVESPDLMALPRDSDLKTIAAIKAEAADPELAMLRWGRREACCWGHCSACLRSTSRSAIACSRVCSMTTGGARWKGPPSHARSKRLQRQRPARRANAPDLTLRIPKSGRVLRRPAAKCGGAFDHAARGRVGRRCSFGRDGPAWQPIQT